MNIGEIIAEVDEVWAPNSVSAERKCRWLSQDQWQVMRKVSLPGTTDIIYTAAGVAAYPLPPNCQPDRLQHVVLAGSDGSAVEYAYRDVNDSNHYGNWYTILPANVLLLSEPPLETDLSLVLFYTAWPIGFSETDLTATPSVPEPYQDYLVKKLAARCAKANASAGGSDRDILLANNFEAEAAELLQAMTREYSPEPDAGFKMEVNW